MPRGRALSIMLSHFSARAAALLIVAQSPAGGIVITNNRERKIIVSVTDVVQGDNKPVRGRFGRRALPAVPVPHRMSDRYLYRARPSRYGPEARKTIPDLSIRTSKRAR